jgi:AraC-like DNA-binding protein
MITQVDAGQLRLKHIAQRAAVSRSTMRRRLATTGGFRQARERALVTAAVRRLRTTDDSVEAIAAELGYSDARSLRRFLKAATGTTPQRIRAEGIPSDPDDGAVRSRLQAIGAMMGA